MAEPLHQQQLGPVHRIRQRHHQAVGALAAKRQDLLSGGSGRIQSTQGIGVRLPALARFEVLDAQPLGGQAQHFSRPDQAFVEQHPGGMEPRGVGTGQGPVQRRGAERSAIHE